MKRAIACAFLLAAIAARAGELRAGAAAVKITPPLGAPMAGYYYNRAAEGVHDELHAKAIVLEQDGSRAALVACDLASIPRGIVEQARKLAESASGIPAAAVMISATHTHTGPALSDRAAGSGAVESEMQRIGRGYAESLPAKIAEAVRLAAANLRPARVSAAIGREESLAFNRRFFMKDGTVGWNPGKLNPNIVRPAGSTDPEVPLVYFETVDAKPLAAYVNFALHLDTVGGTHFSADYPYTLSTLLAKVKGEDLLTAFTIGTAGNVNHIDVSTKAPQKGHGEAARIGTVLAAAVLKSFGRLTPLDPTALRVRSEIVKLPLAEFTTSELQKAREVAPKYGKPNAAPFLDFVRAFKVLDVAGREGRPLEAEVQVIALGGQVAWVGLPGEIFVELGLAIKKASPFPYTVVAELANGNLGYVPDRKAYPEGNYEPISARCAAGSGELLTDAALRLLRSQR